MRNKILYSALIAVLMVGGLAIIARLLPGTESIFDDSAGDTGDSDQDNSLDCRWACERLAMCRHPLAGETCEDLCRDSWDEETIRCVQFAACREITGECLDAAADVGCEAACEKVEDCGLFLSGENCLETCRAEWDRDLRECLTMTECDEIEAVCLPAIQPTECTLFCDKLAECDLLPGSDAGDCLESCLTLDDPELRECVAQVACELIEPVCLADDYDPLCLEACQRLEACEALGDIEPDYCPAACMGAWDDGTLACLFDRACEELEPVCLGRAEPVCEDVCGKLVECGLEDEPADCAITCSTSLSDEGRQCILEAPCEQIDGVCFGVQPDLCAVVCEKLINCELDEDFEVCYAACEQAPDLALIRCILAFPCAAIVDNCS
ncbi:MAG: hypothetical protein P9L99_03935 [Candidatus Lernaella stagnicola]|nr:hypothetical protein [Candidatus Lernaella stagnicola]